VPHFVRLGPADRSALVGAKVFVGVRFVLVRNLVCDTDVVVVFMAQKIPFISDIEQLLRKSAIEINGQYVGIAKERLKLGIVTVYLGISNGGTETLPNQSAGGLVEQLVQGSLIRYGSGESHDKGCHRFGGFFATDMFIVGITKIFSNVL